MISISILNYVHSIKFEAFKLNNSFYNIMHYINLTTDYHVTIGSIVHCWEVVKRDIAGQDGKSGGRVLLTGLGLNMLFGNSKSS